MNPSLSGTSIGPASKGGIIDSIRNWFGSTGFGQWAGQTANKVAGDIQASSPGSYSSTQTSAPVLPKPVAGNNILGIKTAEASTGPMLQPGQRFIGDTGSANDNAVWNTINMPGFGTTLTDAGVNTSDSIIASKLNNPVPVNFNIPSSDTYSSRSLSPMTMGDAMGYLNNAKNGMLNGTNGMVPSNDFLKGFLGASADFSNTSAALNSERLAQINQIQSLYTQGGITKEGRDSAINDVNTKYGQTVAQLEVANQGSNANLDAYTRFYNTFMKPEGYAPGTTLMTPTGQVVATTGGASQQTILSGAMTLWQAAGSPTNADGTPNIAPYMQTVQQYYGSGFGNGMVGSPGLSNGAAMGGPTSQMPPQLQTYLQASGGQYINEDKVPAAQKDIIKQLAAQNGIPYLTSGDVQSVQAIDYTKQNLMQLESVVNDVLGSGVVGRVGNTIKGLVNAVFQNDTRLVAFNQARETAIKQIQSLVAGSGSGFRLTQPEIEQAVSQLPTQNDSLEYAKAKLAWINSFLDTKRNIALTGKAGPATAVSNNSLYDF